MNYSRSRSAFRFLLIPVFCFFFSILVAGCGGGGDSYGDNGGGNIDEPLTQSEMLDALGVDTNIGARVSETGEWLSDDYNPMLKKITQLNKRSEIFLAGIQGEVESAEGHGIR